jgi:predicted nucleic acid-binding protein
MNANNVFFSTDILFYFQDSSNPDKQRRAIQLFRRYLNHGQVFISTQVLKEFCNVGIKKLHLDVPKLMSLLDEFSRSLTVVAENEQLIKEALDIHLMQRYSFYDSLIIAAAISADCEILFTEDLDNNQEIDGIKIVNPFA